jgi:glycosyltransferase involved in cell wall biosynthesis
MMALEITPGKQARVDPLTQKESTGRPFHVIMVAASPFPLPQGSQVLIAGLAGNLQRRGHSVEIVAYPTGKPDSRVNVPVRRTPGLPFYRRLDPGPSVWKPLLDVLLARKLKSEVTEKRPDVLHTHNFEGLLAALWVRRRTGIPVVHHLHNLMEPELPAYFRFRPMRWAGRLLGRWVDAHLPRRADACIVLNEQAACCLKYNGVPSERVHIIPPSVDILPPIKPPEQVRQQRGLGDGPIVLYSGNLDRYQDIGFLLRAFRKVRVTRPDVLLILATHSGIEGRQEETLRRRLREGERLLTVSGWQEMLDLIHACDVAVSPRQECWGFPIKVLNYMASARPIVSAAGSAQGLRHGETALVVSNQDELAFAEAIVALLQDPSLAKRLGRAARVEAEQQRDSISSTEAVEAVYETVKRQARPSAGRDTP